MRHVSIKLETPCEFINVTPVNPLISQCEIKVCYVGEDPNRNGSIITKEVKELKETQNFYKPEDQMYMDINRKVESLSEYLPKQMTTEEVKDMIRAYINATELDNVGRITGAIVKEVGSRFDKSKISNLVKEVLSE